MASPAEAREALTGLTRLAAADLARMWVPIAAAPPVAVRDALIDVLPALADEYGTAAAALAADWYDELRAEAGVPGRFYAVQAPLPGMARFEALARWGVDPLFAASPDAAAALTRITGGMQRTIADMHRLTVTESSLQDPQAAGWRRVGEGASCGFCNMLIGRGAVYSDKTVTFKSHDHCNCAASPAWDPGRKVSTQAFQASKRRKPGDEAAQAKRNQATYKWLKANP